MANSRCKLSGAEALRYATGLGHVKLGIARGIQMNLSSPTHQKTERLSAVEHLKMFYRKAVSLVTVLVGTIPVAGAEPQFPMEGDMSIVFPRNETYGAVSPFPIIFGFRGAPALLSWDSTLQWDIQCDWGNLFGSGEITGYDGATLPSEPFLTVNTTKPSFEYLPPDPKNSWYFPDGHDYCILTWSYGFVSTCHKFENGTTALQLWAPVSEGRVGFSLQVGGKTPKDVLSDYKGCPEKGTSRRVVAGSYCPDVGDEDPKAPEPCALDVQKAMSTFLSKVPTGTKTFLGSMPTSSAKATTETAPQPTQTDTGNGGGGSGGNSGTNKKSGARSSNSPAGLSFLLFFGYLLAL